MAHPGGRPTKYNEDMPAKVDEYLAECKVWWDEFHKTRGEKSDSYERIINVKLPSIDGFADYIDVNKSTLYEWSNKHSEFSGSLDKILRRQHNMLTEGGIAGYFQPVITKLMLSHNHGYREKSDLTSNSETIVFSIPSEVANKHGIKSQAETDRQE